MSTPANPHRTLLNWVIDLRKEEIDRSIAQRGHSCLAGNYRERVTTKEMELRQLVSACYACDTQVGFAEQERRLNGLRDATIEVIHWQLPLVGHRREELPSRSFRPSEGCGLAGMYLIEKLNALYPHIDAVEPLAAWCVVVAESTPQPKGIPLAEANIRVRDWLEANAKENPLAVTRDAVADATGVSKGQVSNTLAWKAFQEGRSKLKQGSVREVPLSEEMQVFIPSDIVPPDELVALIEEQQQEKEEELRRHKRRHRPS